MGGRGARGGAGQAEAERGGGGTGGGGAAGSTQGASGGGTQAAGGSSAGGQAWPPGLRGERHASACAGGAAGGAGVGVGDTTNSGRTDVEGFAGRLVDHAEAYAGAAGGAAESHGAVSGGGAGRARGAVRGDHGRGDAVPPVGFPQGGDGQVLPRVPLVQDGGSRAARVLQRDGGGRGGVPAAPLPDLRLQRRAGRRAHVGQHGAMDGGLCGVRRRDDVRAGAEALRSVRVR